MISHVLSHIGTNIHRSRPTKGAFHFGHHGDFNPSAPFGRKLTTTTTCSTTLTFPHPVDDALSILKSIIFDRFSNDPLFNIWLHDLLGKTPTDLPSLAPFSPSNIARQSPCLHQAYPPQSSPVPPSYVMDPTDVDMLDNSPPRLAGNKRAAANSPAITPPNTTRPEPQIQEEKEVTTVLKPSRLEDKFGKPPKKKLSSKSPDDSISCVGEQDPEINLLDQSTYEALLQEPPPPTPAQYLQYDFDEDDEYTRLNLVKYNFLKLEEALRQKTLKCKQQDRSQAHPKWGPFRLEASSLSEILDVMNRKGKKALSFLSTDYLLSTGDFVLDTEDVPTYTILCYAGPKRIVDQLLEAQNNANIDKTDFGPFCLSRDNDVPKKICILKAGKLVHSFDLSSTPLPQKDEWVPVGQRGTYTKKKKITFDKTPVKQQGAQFRDAPNKFSALADHDDTIDKETHALPPSTRPYRSRTTQLTVDSSSTTSNKGQAGSVDLSGSEDDVYRHKDRRNEEDIEMSSKAGSEGEQSDTISKPDGPPATPRVIEISTHTPEWVEDESDGEAACSGDEKSPPKRNLQDIVPPATVATDSSTTVCSSLSHSTNPSAMIDPRSGQNLLTVEIQMQPEKDNLEVMLTETKNLLGYVQGLDLSAKFVSRGLTQDNISLPDLTSPTCEHWPQTFAAAQGWFQTSASYIFSLAPISEKQLQNRLETRRNRARTDETDAKRRKSKRESDREDRGPTSMYVTLNLYSSIPNIKSLLDSMNIDLRKSNVRVSLKSLQCWESNSKKMLCSVQSGLCVEGVKQLLLHRLKEMEKKLCRHGRLNTIEWYDKDLPAVHVTLRNIRELKLPSDPQEREQLSFDPFPRSSRFAYFIEASDTAWARLDPLITMMIDTNNIAYAFGPSAFIMDVPPPTPTMERVRAHHKHGRISMGYNIATTVLECSEIQLYDYEVKVKMATVPKLDADGKPTGKDERPRPPYARTTIRKELQQLRVNGEQIFHTAVMVCKGPETGISGIVVSYDPNDDLYKEKYEFAKRTVANLACFMFHWLGQRGYCDSTRSRLMRSFYVEKSQLAPQSSWNPTTLQAISHFAGRTSTYLMDNARYDPYLRAQIHTHSSTFVDMSDTVRKGLLKSLGYDPKEKGCDVGSKISGVSNLTGDGDTTGASTVNSGATHNRVLRTKEYAKQLADTKEKNAEQAAEISTLRAQMQHLTQLIAGLSSQQGSPHLSGSGATRPQDEGGGVALQGT